MSHKIVIILAKASWCPHCVHFTPIYEMAKQKIKPNLIDNCSINFVSFELDKQNEKLKFDKDYPGLSLFLKGYPTVYIHMTENKNNTTPTIDTIDHTIATEQGNKGNIQAAEEFIQNIVNKYKSIKSGNKVEYVSVQRGGMNNFRTSLEESNYRNKYLKYKSKYLELKK